MVSDTPLKQQKPRPDCLCYDNENIACWRGRRNLCGINSCKRDGAIKVHHYRKPEYTLRVWFSYFSLWWCTTGRWFISKRSPLDMMKFNRIAIDFVLKLVSKNVSLYLESCFQKTSLGGRFAFRLVNLRWMRVIAVIGKSGERGPARLRRPSASS